MNLFQNLTLVDLNEFEEIRLGKVSMYEIDNLRRENSIYEITPVNSLPIYLSLTSEYSVISITQDSLLFDSPVLIITNNHVSLGNTRNIASNTLNSSELLAITDYQDNNIFYVIYPKNGFVFGNY